MTASHAIALLSAALLAQAAAPSARTVAQEAVIPEDYPTERYQPIWEKSPFTLSSAAEEPTAGFASNLVLVGIGAIDDSFYARLLDRTSQQRWSVEQGTPYNGIELVSVDTHENPEQASVRLKKGAEEAVVRYDPAMLTAAAAPTAPVGIPKPPRPNPNPGASANNQPIPQTTTNKIPTPRTRRIIIPSRPNR